MNSLISGPCFPFEFLHAEIIRYEKKREAEKIDKRKSWIEQMRNNPQMDISLLDEQLKSVKQVFIQGNADTHLEALGYRVGFVLVEKIAKDLPRIITELERMKFLCKEFWTAAFGKQVDNLRTNHQGVYVVQDNKFFILLNFAEGKQCVEESAIYLAFPCGVISNCCCCCCCCCCCSCSAGDIGCSATRRKWWVDIGRCGSSDISYSIIIFHNTKNRKHPKDQAKTARNDTVGYVRRSIHARFNNFCGCKYSSNLFW